MTGRKMSREEVFVGAMNAAISGLMVGQSEALVGNWMNGYPEVQRRDQERIEKIGEIAFIAARDAIEWWEDQFGDCDGQEASQ